VYEHESMDIFFSTQKFMDVVQLFIGNFYKNIETAP